VAHEGPGLISGALGDAGHRFDVIRPDLGDPLPDHRSIAGLVVMGGPMGVHDADDHPWLLPERALIAAVAEDGKPVLGVCLGAQQIAAALGAEVRTGPSLEIGLGQVELTAEGRRDPVAGPEYGGLAATTLPCVHWHRDTFSIPAGAVHLAATRTYPHQAFRWGAKVYGLQFHVEVDAALAASWAPHLPAGVTLEGPQLAQVETVGRRLLRRFAERSLLPVRVPDGSLAARGSRR
jgi:GMP synthase-like glutamine amidotransferase